MLIFGQLGYPNSIYRVCVGQNRGVLLVKVPREVSRRKDYKGQHQYGAKAYRWIA